MIIGTAGHIDHGKTSLVNALTGVDTDRLPEEKRRGITIELGFAQWKLSDGTVVGVVDVPGHERFVKAMAAGAGGVDVVLMVVAADEGVMPQTREHLDICGYLGARRGVIALSKSDALAGLGAEWRELVEADLRQLVSGTFLEKAPIVACSARTGEGLDALRGALEKAVRSGDSQRSAEGPLFLPIDRAFSVKGFGTVVTGTLLSGTVAVEEQVVLSPELATGAGGGTLRIRSLEVHGRRVERATAGHRVAMNLPGIEAGGVVRGQVVTRPGELPVSRVLDVELYGAWAREKLARARKLRLHLGTDQVDATVVRLEPRPPEDEDGARTSTDRGVLAQLRLAREVAALPGQRFILRGGRAVEGRGATVAGGRVLSIAARKRRRAEGGRLAVLVEASPEQQLRWLLDEAGPAGRTVRELTARSGLSGKTVARQLEVASAQGWATLLDKESRLYVPTAVLDKLAAKALRLLEAFHERQPQSEGLPREELRQRLGVASERLFSRVMGLLVEGRVEPVGELMRLEGKGRSLGQAEEALRAALLEALDEGGLAPAGPAELARRFGVAPEQLKGLLGVVVAGGQVVKVSEELFYSRVALEGLRERLVEHLKVHGEISTQGFKELVGQSRKFVIPLSEYFDRQKVTLRVGEKRVLRRA